MKRYTLIFPYKKEVREVVTYDYTRYELEKFMLESAGYKIAYQNSETHGSDEYYTYVYVQL